MKSLSIVDIVPLSLLLISYLHSSYGLSVHESDAHTEEPIPFSVEVLICASLLYCARVSWPKNAVYKLNDALTILSNA